MRKWRQVKNLTATVKLLSGVGDETGAEDNDNSKFNDEMMEKFFRACEFGDIPTVLKMLRDNPDFDVNAEDVLGRSALNLAVGSEHLEVVEGLLPRSSASNIQDALLQAINLGHEQIAEVILKHPKYKKCRENLGQARASGLSVDSRQFSSDITPIILAAQKNQFGIVYLLLIMGETIERPHHALCDCPHCREMFQSDELRLAKARLNTYQGLASEAYISLTSQDPIVTAFELTRELNEVAGIEKYFNKRYKEAADRLSNYVVKLLDCVRNNAELMVLLKRGSEGNEVQDQLTLLKMALQYQERKFVAHPSCQQKVVRIWYSELRQFERANWIIRWMMMLFVIVLYPFIFIIHMIAPYSKVGRFLNLPVVKFVAHTSSFVLFLGLLFVYSFVYKPEVHNIVTAQNLTEQQLKQEGYVTDHPEFKVLHQFYLVYGQNQTHLPWPWFAIRENHLNYNDWTIIAFIVGMLVRESSQIHSEGAGVYFDSPYNYLDSFMLMMYICCFSLKITANNLVARACEFFYEEDSWRLLVTGDPLALYQCYWLNSDRYYWDPFDPQFVAEGLFATANVLSFNRFSNILPAAEVLGPMHTSLGRMIKNIGIFSLIFLMVFLAFMVGLHNLYWYYGAEMRSKVETSVHVPPGTLEGELAFGNLEYTFRTVFWSLFGLGGKQAVRLEEFGPSTKFIESVGYILYGTYLISTVIVLLNMLIAMMTRSYEKTAQEADIEWKFSRTKLYMEYIDEGSTLPVPLNIIPNPYKIFLTIRNFWRSCCCQPDKHKINFDEEDQYRTSETSGTNEHGKFSFRRIGLRDAAHILQNGGHDHTFEGNIHQKRAYQQVVEKVVRRYVLQRHKEEATNETNMDELKQDISSFRYEVLNQLSTFEGGRQELLDEMRKLTKRINYKNQTLGLYENVDDGATPLDHSPPCNSSRQEDNDPAEDMTLLNVLTRKPSKPPTPLVTFAVPSPQSRSFSSPLSHPDTEETSSVDESVVSALPDDPLVRQLMTRRSNSLRMGPLPPTSLHKQQSHQQ